MLIFAAYRKSFFTQIDNLVPGYKLLLIFLLSFAGMCLILLVSRLMLILIDALQSFLEKRKKYYLCEEKSSILLS